MQRCMLAAARCPLLAAPSAAWLPGRQGHRAVPRLLEQCRWIQQPAACTARLHASIVQQQSAVEGALRRERGPALSSSVRLYRSSHSLPPTAASTATASGASAMKASSTRAPPANQAETVGYERALAAVGRRWTKERRHCRRSVKHLAAALSRPTGAHLATSSREPRPAPRASLGTRPPQRRPWIATSSVHRLFGLV